MKTKTTMKSTIGKCSVWVFGSVIGTAGWIEGKVLDVGEGFQNKSEATAWARGAMARLNVPGKSVATHYEIGRAY